MKNLKLYLVRHGQSEGNVNKQVYFEKSDCDIQLTEKGKEDALDAANAILSLSNDSHFGMFHSTYKRAKQTSEIIHERMENYPGVSLDKARSSPLCRERDWGSLRDIVNSRSKCDEHFNFYYRPLNGESFSDAYQRAAVFHQWLLNTTTSISNIVVAHGEFHRVYLMYLLGWDIEEFDKWGHLKNGGVWAVEDGELHESTPLRKNKYVH